MQDPDTRRKIEALGNVLTPEVLPAVRALFLAEQDALKARLDRTHVDISYGPHERHRLDIYLPLNTSSPRPVFVWVHGGGFLRGDKYDPTNPYNAHMGRWAADHGYVGIVINYRLAPDDVWPSGGEDVALALDWVRSHIREYGGAPENIVLGGTSAGAAHTAHYLQLALGRERLSGAVLLSGLYGWTPLDDRDRLYFGADPSKDAERRTKDAVTNTDIPLFVACAEFDPPRFQAETMGLLGARFATKGQLPTSMIVRGHNHYSISYHLGTRDTRLSDELIQFLGTVTHR